MSGLIAHRATFSAHTTGIASRIAHGMVIQMLIHQEVKSNRMARAKKTDLNEHRACSYRLNTYRFISWIDEGLCGAEQCLCRAIGDDNLVLRYNIAVELWGIQFT